MYIIQNHYLYNDYFNRMVQNDNDKDIEQFKIGIQHYLLKIEKWDYFYFYRYSTIGLIGFWVYDISCYVLLCLNLNINKLKFEQEK